MITSIRLVNFKCFEDLTLNCSPLNLLCGLNGMGKSSVLQAILALRQSYRSGELANGQLVLNADLIDLGTGMDVLWEDAQSDQIGIELQSDHCDQRWRSYFKYTADSDRLDIASQRKPKWTMPQSWTEIPPMGGHVLHIGADRIGPKNIHMLTRSRAIDYDLGDVCQYTLNCLIHHQNQLIDKDDPRSSGLVNLRLIDAVNHWLQNVSPGAYLQLQSLLNAGVLLAGFSFSREDDVSTRVFRATNVGFGLSYTLPVVLALLLFAYRSGALCMIENPEAHLHPKGQTRLAELAVRAAKAGVQVVVETHSDHFLDGVRIAVRQGLIHRNDVSIHYFERKGLASLVQSPSIDNDGRLSFWPNGFFDQHDENLLKLLSTVGMAD